jgi:hypothetical protein
VSTGSKGASRGQAAVELALGLLVFITVVVFGIHFAEIGYLGARVATATHSAIFRATGERAHEAGSDMRLYGTVAGRVTSEHKKSWNDFNPTSGEGSEAVSHVMTKIEKTEGNLVRCFNEDDLKSNLLVIAPTAYGDNKGGIRCGAQATVSILPVFPRNFLDNNWGLKTAHYNGPTSFRVCATARNQRGGECGRIPILVGDYSLQGATKSESRGNDLFRGGNREFKELVDKTFVASPMCIASGLMMAQLKLLPQVTTCNSVLSFKPHEDGLRQSMTGHSTRGPWHTAGYKGTLRDKDNKAYYLGVER